MRRRCLRLRTELEAAADKFDPVGRSGHSKHAGDRRHYDGKPDQDGRRQGLRSPFWTVSAKETASRVIAIDLGIADVAGGHPQVAVARDRLDFEDTGATPRRAGDEPGPQRMPAGQRRIVAGRLGDGLDQAYNGAVAYWLVRQLPSPANPAEHEALRHPAGLQPGVGRGHRTRTVSVRDGHRRPPRLPGLGSPQRAGETDCKLGVRPHRPQPVADADGQDFGVGRGLLRRRRGAQLPDAGHDFSDRPAAVGALRRLVPGELVPGELVRAADGGQPPDDGRRRASGLSCAGASGSAARRVRRPPPGPVDAVTRRGVLHRHSGTISRGTTPGQYPSWELVRPCC